MDNPSFSSLSADFTSFNNITTQTKPNMISYSQNSAFTPVNGPLSYPSAAAPSSSSSNNSLRPDYYTYRMQTEDEAEKLRKKQERSSQSKAARMGRKLARERSLSMRNSQTRTVIYNPLRRRNNDQYEFLTPYNKNLRVLVKKELRHSDVELNPGRIIIPKRDAEENLPPLEEGQIIHLVLKEINTNQEWKLIFKYWINNKGRMYVLDGTSAFVKENGLEIGDFLTIYEEESKNLYFSIKKRERPVQEEEELVIPNQNQMCMPEEEEASFYLLLEQLKHKEQGGASFYPLFSPPPATDFHPFPPASPAANNFYPWQPASPAMQNAYSAIDKYCYSDGLGFPYY